MADAEAPQAAPEQEEARDAVESGSDDDGGLGEGNASGSGGEDEDAGGDAAGTSAAAGGEVRRVSSCYARSLGAATGRFWGCGSALRCDFRVAA